MGDVNRTIRTTWVGNGGNVLSVIGRLNNELRGVGTTGDQVNRKTGLLGQQFRALGTTIRYALAGSVIFGSIRALSLLSDYQTKLGQILAISAQLNQQGGVVPGLDVNQLNRNIQDLSTDTVRPLSEVQESIYTIQSSFQDLNQKQIKEFARIFLETSSTTATGAKEATNAIVGMMGAFGGPDQNNVRTAERMSDIFYRILRFSRVFRGEDLAQQMGRLSSSATAGGFTVEQMGGLLATASAPGGSPAVISRGMSQLMREIRFPKTADQKEAYRAAGLPTDPNQLSRMPGMQILQKMIAAVQAKGGISANLGAMKAIGEDQDLTDTPGLSNTVGLAGGGAGLSRALFSRSEGFLQFVTLVSQGTDRINQKVKQMDQGLTQAQGFKEFRDQATLARASTAWQTFSVSFVQSMNPVLNVMASLVENTTTFLRHHPRVGQGLAAGLVGVTVASRFGLLSKVGRTLFGGRGLAGAGKLEAMPNAVPRALLEAEAMPAALAGVGQGSRAAPFWVIIHPISWALGAPGSAGGGVTGGGGSKVIPPWLQNKWLMRGGAIAGMAMLAGNGLATGSSEADRRQSFKEVLDMIRGNPGIFPRLSQTLPMIESGDDALTAGQKQVFQQLAGGRIRPAQAEAMLRRFASRRQVVPGQTGGIGAFFGNIAGAISRPAGRELQLKGQADVTVNVNIKDGDGNITRKKVHIPTTMWPQFSGGRFPQNQGHPSGVHGGPAE